MALLASRDPRGRFQAGAKPGPGRPALLDSELGRALRAAVNRALDRHPGPVDFGSVADLLHALASRARRLAREEETERNRAA